MKIYSTFKFDNYPEILKEYKKIVSLRNKLMKISMGKQGDALLVHKEIEEYESGHISKLIFDTFNKSVKYIYHEQKGKKLWSEVFGDNYDILTKEQKEDLTGLIDGDFVYRLPQEYYEFDPYLEGYYEENLK